MLKTFILVLLLLCCVLRVESIKKVREMYSTQDCTGPIIEASLQEVTTNSCTPSCETALSYSFKTLCTETYTPNYPYYTTTFYQDSNCTTGNEMNVNYTPLGCIRGIQLNVCNTTHYSTSFCTGCSNCATSTMTPTNVCQFFRKVTCGANSAAHTNSIAFIVFALVFVLVVL